MLALFNERDSDEYAATTRHAVHYRVAQRSMWVGGASAHVSQACGEHYF
jgi:hypothetical protein